MTTYRTVLPFSANGPAATGEQAEDATARRTWRDWVGMYGSDENTVICLIEERDGRELVLTAWEHRRVVEPPPAAPESTACASPRNRYTQARGYYGVFRLVTIGSPSAASPVTTSA